MGGGLIHFFVVYRVCGAEKKAFVAVFAGAPVHFAAAVGADQKRGRGMRETRC